MPVLEKEAPIDLQEQLIRRAWEDEQFAELLRTNPRVAIAEETGIELPGDVNIQVHQEDETTFHLVVPQPHSTANVIQPPPARAPMEKSGPLGTNVTVHPQLCC